MSLAWENLIYLVAAVLFILGIKGMTHPRTAVRGNLMSAVAMGLAVVATLALGAPAAGTGFNWWVIFAGLIVGSAVGLFLALRVQMTQMPEMVALLNGSGGIASVLVAWTAMIVVFMADVQTSAASALTVLIGAVTCSGSLIAFGKLAEFKTFKKDWALPANQAINAALLALSLMMAVFIMIWPGQAPWMIAILVLLSLALGVTLVIPIGGADMPVVIALLNSYSGLAAAMSGFVINNTVLIIAGSLVGASGLILTAIMCRAMNRSLPNVLFGKMAAGGIKMTDDEVYGGKVKSTTAEEVAMLLDDAQRVVIVPGYGMAVSQAQHAVRDLYRELSEKGKDVEFAIHPVAGRMPGHMNVLLAEVDIPYDKLKEAEEINRTIETADVVIVLGANDVVNPDARTNPNSPIAGMPIIDVDKARTVVVIKRSLSPGFAGIPNPLFAADNALMFFGDGKKAVVDMLAEVKAL
ncbi:MAG: NAD(P)(+) transhydrogenase (Re/Si-specific) subunit beta [Phycisphaerae bacterium]